MFIGCAATLLRPATAASGGLRPQDVFAAVPYTVTGNQQDVTFGFQPDAFWDKGRSGTTNHLLVSAVRGFDKATLSNTTGAEASVAGIFSQTATGIQIGAGQLGTGTSRIAWGYKKAAKFYTEVVYTGDGTTGRQIAHDLGALVGFGSVKRLDTTSSWPSFHRSATGDLVLNTTAAQTASRAIITAADASTFTVSSNVDINASGGTYLARIWAHDPDTTNGTIQCGSGTVTLPWVPQWVLYKDAGATGNWTIIDSTRGFTLGLNPNLSNAESAASGATVSGSTITFTGLTTPIWCAIRAPV